LLPAPEDALAPGDECVRPAEEFRDGDAVRELPGVLAVAVTSGDGVKMIGMLVDGDPVQPATATDASTTSAATVPFPLVIRIFMMPPLMPRDLPRDPRFQASANCASGERATALPTDYYPLPIRHTRREEEPHR
jgi:hypothetical protein